MKINKSFFQRRWYDIRLGHGYYMVYVMALSNFIIISYKLLLENIPIINNLLGNIIVYAIFWVIFYPILSSTIGYIHRTRQLPLEQIALTQSSPIQMKFYRLTLEIMTKRLSKDEEDKAIEFFKELENKGYSVYKNGR